MEQLAYTLLAYINNVIEEDMNYHIAKKFLENIYKIKDYSLEDIAYECNVSSRTINRFCKKKSAIIILRPKKNIYYIRSLEMVNPVMKRLSSKLFFHSILT